MKPLLRYLLHNQGFRIYFQPQISVVLFWGRVACGFWFTDDLQVYTVSIPMPAADFTYSVVAEFDGGAPSLATPTVGEQSVVVV